MSQANVLLQGTRVRLRPPDMTTAPQFQEWMNDTDTRHLIGGTAYPISLAAQEEFLRPRQKTSWDDGVFLVVEATDGPTPVLIGSIELRQFNAEARRCQVGMLIGDPAYRGRGYGTEALRLVCRFAFDEMGLERVFLDTFDFNTRAIRAYEKVGFVQEGRLRRHAYLGGVYYDVIAMGLLRDEFVDG